MNGVRAFLEWSRQNCTRRAFLLAGAGSVAALAGLGFFARKPARRFTGKILGASAVVGHLLRDGKIPASTENVRTGIVIVGGGIAGLAAARQLARTGFDDFLLLELEEQLGGNSCSGRNAVSAYPWGAHYVPLQNPETKEVIELFEDLGVITGYDGEGVPIYNEFHLCADPEERLFLHGQWQEDLVPQIGVSERDREQYRRFFAAMDEFRSAVGSDRRPAFAIPIDESSRDEEFRKLDQISMAHWMAGNGFDSAPLRWYVNYCCRDDYGAEMNDTSAWAGIHYFASRRGKGTNAGEATVVTWPEGNGWIVDRLREWPGTRVRSSAVVFQIEQSNGGVTVDYYDVTRRHSVRVAAEAVVFAAPRFVASRVVRDLPPAAGFVYSPWMVANLTLDYLPGGEGAPPAWDNVLYGSDSLGYVVATHQDLHPFPQRTVITYYLPLSGKEPAIARHEALARSWEDWASLIVNDLERAHPGLGSQIAHLDVWLWGHGMIRPVPGFIWGEERQRALNPHGRVVFAHSDMSGISIFEEAYTRGVQAAREILRVVQRA